MENQALSIMRPQVARIESYPEVARRLEQHIKETEGQIGRIDELLDQFGADSSTLKDFCPLLLRKHGGDGAYDSR